MTNDPMVEKLVWDYVAACSARDLERIWTFYSDDVIYEDCALGQVHVGLEATKKFYTETMMGLDVDWTVDTVVATAGGFAVAGLMKGKHVTDLPGMPATHRDFSVPCASVGEVRDGKITRNRDYWNNYDLLKQLGLLKRG
jgi:steroid delta-isomerase-like uncharacterized protein